MDVNTDLGGQTYLIFNYGFAVAALRGRRARWTARRRASCRSTTSTLWLRKDFAGGFNAAFGVRYLGEQFVNNTNTLRARRLHDLLGRRRLSTTSRWEWSLNAENLFNNDDYFLPGHFSNNVFPGQPINVTTTVRLRWN